VGDQRKGLVIAHPQNGRDHFGVTKTNQAHGKVYPRLGPCSHAGCVQRELGTGEPKAVVWAAGGLSFFDCRALIRHIVEDPEWGKRRYGIDAMRAPYGCMYESDEGGPFLQYLINLIVAGSDLGCIYRWTEGTYSDHPGRARYSPMLRGSRAGRDRYLSKEGGAYCVVGNNFTP
jgi:hypothetical protein